MRPDDANPLRAQTLAEFLVLVRRREELSQVEIGNKFGLTRTQVYHAEKGIIERPYRYLRGIQRWLNEAEVMHMLDLLRILDIENIKSAQ